MRSLYGAEPGTYRISVFGNDATDYELTILVAEPDGVIVDETRAVTLELATYTNTR